MGPLGFLLLFGGGAAAVAAIAGSGEGSDPVIAHLILLDVDPDAPPGTTKVGGSTQTDVGPNGDFVVEIAVGSVPPGVGSRSFGVQLDIASTYYVKPTNLYYGESGVQFCSGVRMTAKIVVDGDGARVEDIAQQPLPTFCEKDVTEGMADKLRAWPRQGNAGGASDTTPKATSLVVREGKIYLTVVASKLFFGDTEVFAAGEGHTMQWYQHHTDALRYPLGVRFELELVPL